MTGCGKTFKYDPALIKKFSPEYLNMILSTLIIVREIYLVGLQNHSNWRVS